mgnify:CR=1 FL=1
MKDELKKIFDELESDAYNKDYHTYDYKIANQIIRKYFERLFPAEREAGLPRQWQKRPLCNGTGITSTPLARTIYSTHQFCSICNGKKIILV